MFRTIAAMLVVAVVPALGFAAGPGGYGPKGGTISVGKGFYGQKFSGGYFYPGRNYNHWSSRCWNPNYNCYTYWCPTTSCSYYWCQPDNCFYPVSYCPYRTYTWQNSYVVTSVPVVQYRTVTTQTVTYRPEVQTTVTYRPEVQTTVTQQAINAPPVYGPSAPPGPSGPGLPVGIQGPGPQSANPQ